VADLIIRGKKFFKVSGELAAILAQLFPDEVQKLNQPPALNLGQGHQPPINQRKPVWGVGIQKRNGRAVLTLVIPTGEEFQYQFKPEDAQATFTRMGWPVPEQYLKAYAEEHGRQPVDDGYRAATPELSLMAEHYQPGKFNCTPTPERPPLP